MCEKLDSGSLRFESRQSWRRSCSGYCNKTSQRTVALLPLGLPWNPGAGNTARRCELWVTELVDISEDTQVLDYWVKHTSQDFYSAQECGHLQRQCFHSRFPSDSLGISVAGVRAYKEMAHLFLAFD